MTTSHDEVRENKEKVCSKTGEVIRPATQRNRWWLMWLFPVTGFFALIWFLIRVVPKPDRANYPCMRIAFPLASTFVVWIAGLIASVLAFRRAQMHFRKSRYVVAFLCLVIGVAAVYIPMSTVSKLVEAATPDPTWYVPTDADGLPQAANAPLGVGRGVYPGRVVWSHDPDATNWDGLEPNWWEDQYTDPDTIEAMLSNAILDLAGEDMEAAAWDALFRNVNKRRGKGDVGFTAGEKIAVKVNFVNCSSDTFDRTGPKSLFSCMPAPQLVRSLARQLVNNANVPPSSITFFDATKLAIDPFYVPIVSELGDVQFGEWVGGEGRFQIQYDYSTRVWWSVPDDDPLGTERLNPTYLPVCVTQADYVINLANMKGHGGAGITLCGKNHYGTILSGPGGPRVFEKDPETNNNFCSMPAWAGVHEYHFTHEHGDGFPRREMGSYHPMVDIMGHPDVGDKTVLFILDMFYTSHKQGKPFGPQYKWQMYPFNDDWCSSFLISQDGVAIDSVGLDFMRNDVLNADFGGVIDIGDTPDNYMHEAALANDPPSGSFYDPGATGVASPSIGVHEHWNDPLNKQYTGNLKTATGIELIQSPRIEGDITGAGVNLEDLAIIVGFWLNSGCDLEANSWCSGADINHDTFVNYADFAILAGDFGTGLPPEIP
jgi:hypothetical protein